MVVWKAKKIAASSFFLFVIGTVIVIAEASLKPGWLAVEAVWIVFC